MGNTWEYPPPAAPPFIPNTGPREGCLIVTTADLFRFDNAWANPMLMVVFPSPAGVGVIALTRCLAVGLARHNIRVNCVAPGLMDTPLVAPLMNETRIRTVEERVPLKRHGKAEETAYTVLFLASPEASFITGQTLPVDGGMAAR